MLSCHLLIFFFKIKSFDKKIRNTIRVSNSWDPDQAQCFVGPVRVPNCLQKSSADNTSREGVKSITIFVCLS